MEVLLPVLHLAFGIARSSLAFTLKEFRGQCLWEWLLLAHGSTISWASKLAHTTLRFFHNRLYNFQEWWTDPPSLEPGISNRMRLRCNNNGDLHEEPGMNMDYEGTTRLGFGTHYYKRLVEGKGVRHLVNEAWP
ncbi:hypothetical protein IFM89_004161 [Coptis chinensis]|uniref:Uncharacterized protein n=1 Tax=Coptis chinensis TaxID=261450 RepID=A0A835H6G2_9MAGN|nr:hypothetical protein IFM89_004161 [Coptis chinensis]